MGEKGLRFWLVKASKQKQCSVNGDLVLCDVNGNWHDENEPECAIW